MTAAIPMTRSPEEYPEGPWTADVHPDEVQNFSAAGWVVADPKAKRVAASKPVAEPMQTDANSEPAPTTTEAPTAADPVFPADVNLDDMSAKELRAFAEKHDIAVSPNPATSADKLRKVIREAFAEVTKTMEGDPDGRI